MQHREIITRKLEMTEGNIAKLESLLSRGGDINEFKAILGQTRDIIQDVKDYVQREPRTPNEFNQ
jgi:5-bromo-4-chloroindolyl phosphate hydrolysis protein